ncbi:B12-binding domain-containing radical SAM protein [Candidatus Pacearchaeota archaeon]|nr:B12-binding domain-containing radical SAM protein [Candidatus Pacearchaeota archaeon]
MERKAKVALVSLLGSEHLGNRNNVYNDLEPLGLLYIGGISQEGGCETKLFHPYQISNPSEEDISKNIVKFKPDVLGISSMTNTFNRSVDIAKKVKSQLPDLKVIFGGDHIGTNPSDVMNGNVIDIGVYGEGEATFKEILEEKELNSIGGISFINEEKLIINPPRKRVNDRTSFPLPIRDEEILKAAKVGIMMYPPPSEQTGAASLLFQFGCPLGCTYCSATTLYGGKLTRTSVDLVVEEMKELKKRFGINTAMFTDLTFNLNHQLSEELCKNIEKENLGINWYALVRPTSPKNQPILRDSTIEAMISAGCSKIGFGIESFEESAMKDYHRPTSLDEDLRTLRKIDQEGGLTKVFLIVGHPDETVEYYDKVIDALKRLTPDEVRISYLTPFPGTELWHMLGDKREEALLTTNYDDYTTFHQVIKMKHISPEELNKQRQRILREYYKSKEFENHVKEKLKKHPKFQSSYEEFGQELKRRSFI